jgi:thiol:disulfide interchange protein
MATTQTVTTADPIPWRHDYAAALQEGKTSGKPILIDFSASWCPPCQRMKQTAWPDNRVVQLASSSYVALGLDVDDASAKAPADKYGITEIPAILIVDSDGKVLKQGSFMSADELTAFLSGK